MKSKKCFDNSQVRIATEWLHRPENKRALGFCKSFAEAGFTIIFELTSPGNRIVVEYDTTDMRLLHIRDNVTGEHLCWRGQQHKPRGPRLDKRATVSTSQHHLNKQAATLATPTEEADAR